VGERSKRQHGDEEDEGTRNVHSDACSEIFKFQLEVIFFVFPLPAFVLVQRQCEAVVDALHTPFCKQTHTFSCICLQTLIQSSRSWLRIRVLQLELTRRQEIAIVYHFVFFCL
jgi:hypothetical protein